MIKRGLSRFRRGTTSDLQLPTFCLLKSPSSRCLKLHNQLGNNKLRLEHNGVTSRLHSTAGLVTNVTTSKPAFSPTTRTPPHHFIARFTNLQPVTNTSTQLFLTLRQCRVKGQSSQSPHYIVFRPPTSLENMAQIHNQVSKAHRFTQRARISGSAIETVLGKNILVCSPASRRWLASAAPMF